MEIRNNAPLKKTRHIKLTLTVFFIFNHNIQGLYGKLDLLQVTFKEI